MDLGDGDSDGDPTMGSRRRAEQRMAALRRGRDSGCYLMVSVTDTS